MFSILSKVTPYRDLLTRYLLPQWPRALRMALLLLAAIALQLASPQVIRYFIDTAEAGGPQRNLMLAALAFILFALLQQAVALLAGISSMQVGWTATNRLRTDLMLHLLRLDMPFHKQHTPGELIERVNGDVNHLANFFSRFVIVMLGNALLVLGILALLFREDLWAGAGLSVYTLITLAMLGVIQGIGARRWSEARQAHAEQYGYLEERIAGAEEIQTLGAAPYAMNRLFELMRRYLLKNRAAFVTGSITYNLTNLLYVFGYAIGLGLGVYLFTTGQATIGTAYLITHYVGMLSAPLQGLRREAEDLQQSAASIGRVRELFSLRPAVIHRAPAVTLPALPPGALRVDFEQVSFHYEDNPDVLKEISFELQPGQVLGILGRTGSGKSTLTRLVFRLYDPSGGSIRIGGVDTCDLPLGELRRRVGMVTQDVQLFQASLRQNLTFFNPDFPAEQLERVLRDLRLWAWVEAQPGGLDAKLGAGGQGLSAGEAQLLAFARVFLKDPGLVILDEASSRLDPSTETLMERAVDRLFDRRTGIIIAHRLKTVMRADMILILEDGQVAEFGPREALAADPASRFSALLKTGLEEVLAE